MDLFGELNVNFDDLLVEIPECLDRITDAPYNDDHGLLNLSPSHSSDSGVDILNELLPFSDTIFCQDYEDVVAKKPMSKYERQISSCSDTTELDHPYCQNRKNSVNSHTSDLFQTATNCNESPFSPKNNSPKTQSLAVGRMMRNSEDFESIFLPKPELTPDGKITYIDDRGKVVTVDKSQKNAVMAKLNRKRKKRYISNLEAEVKSLRARNDKLSASKSLNEKKINVLETEVRYLRSVLKNKTMLGSLVKSIAQVPNIQLKCDIGEPGEGYTVPNKKQRFTERLPGKRGPVYDEEFTGGVCLHVSGNKVEIQFCPNCSRNN